MPDSGKFKDLYLNSALTYPCQRTSPLFEKSRLVHHQNRTTVAQMLHHILGSTLIGGRVVR